jgi:hypothetical protein
MGGVAGSRDDRDDEKRAAGVLRRGGREAKVLCMGSRQQRFDDTVRPLHMTPRRRGKSGGQRGCVTVVECSPGKACRGGQGRGPSISGGAEGGGFEHERGVRASNGSREQEGRGGLLRVEQERDKRQNGRGGEGRASLLASASILSIWSQAVELPLRKSSSEQWPCVLQRLGHI